MMFAPRYTVWHCGYLKKGKREMSNAETSAVYAQEIMRLERENAAQLDELHRISEALGTNEGHSSVTHIEILKEENAALRKDAERYRWLRDKIENQNLTIAVADSWHLRSWSGDDSDAVIDAAMKEEGK